MRRGTVILAALMLSGCAAASDADQRSDAGVQLFQLPWTSIAEECEQNLGPAGFSWVLTSPPNEHITGDEWWTSYQPVSYLISSRLGTREEFADMVRRCDAVGVDIIADAVINHMTGQDAPGVGWAGSAYEHYDYPGVYEYDDFHHCGLTASDDIEDYRSREQVQRCELVNLADLDTSSPQVRETIVAYLEDLLSLGVAGFRIDAAKHIDAAELAAILAELPEGTRIMSEVIRGGGEPITPEEYSPFGEVFEFTYARDLGPQIDAGVFTDPKLDGKRPQHVERERAVVFIDNHDTERGEARITARRPELYAIANALMLADDYGTPVVFSGYAFSDRDAGARADAAGRVLPAVCSGPEGEGRGGERTCVHTWPEVTRMLAFRTAVGEAPRLRGIRSGKAYGFEREGRGVLAVNAGTSAEQITIPTTMPAGEYCDAIAGTADGACLGQLVVVAGGEAEIEVPALSAVAIHVAGSR